MDLYRVIFHTRGLSTGFIRQEIVVSAGSTEAARDKVGDILSRQYRLGAWFVDWTIGSATKEA